MIPYLLLAAPKESTNSCENPYATYTIDDSGQSVYENSDYDKKSSDIYLYFTTSVDGKLDISLLKSNDAPMKHQLFIGTSCDDLSLVERTSYEFNHNVDDLAVVKNQQYIIKLVKRSKGYSRYSIAFNLSNEPEPITLNSLTLNSNTLALSVGDTTTLSVTANYSDGSTRVVTDNVTFTSSNTQVASISGSILSALAEGSTIITASVDGITTTLSITINSLNHTPIIQDQNVTLLEDSPFAIELNASDIDGDLLTYTIVTSPIHGTLSGSIPNLIYTPNNNFYGNDNFSVKVSDGINESEVSTISLVVESVNDAPIAQDDTVTTLYSDTTTINITQIAS